MFGPWGSGKSFIIKGLLEHGLKVLVVTTDIGGSGMTSVKLPLRREGKEALLDNLYELVLTTDDEVQTFLNDPESFFPDIYEVDPDFIMWDGFSSWQQVDLSERVGEIGPPSGSNSKEVSSAVDSGLFFEQAQWGMVKNATYRACAKFCDLNNVRTGKVWHKIITAQEGYKSAGKDAGGGFKETKMPLIQGAAGILIGGAFDLILKCKVTTNVDKGTKEYTYQVAGDSLMSKNRGFDLPASMPADMYKLWETISAQAGLTKNATSDTLVSEVKDNV